MNRFHQFFFLLFAAIASISSAGENRIHIHQILEEANDTLFSKQSLRLELLKNCPEVIPELAEWEYQDWHLYDTSLTREKLIEEFNHSLNDEKLPLTLVAFRRETPIGVIALIERGEPEFFDLEDGNPWGGSFHVIPTERAQGLGENMAMVLLKIAQALGYQKIHFYTSNPLIVKWYTSRGAQIIRQQSYRNHMITMMEFLIKDME